MLSLCWAADVASAIDLLLGAGELDIVALIDIRAEYML